MKRIILLSLAITMAFSACKKSEDYPKNSDGSITWISIDTASKIANKDQKMFFIDFYTDWCGWCKKMDKSTFEDPAVIDYMDKNFHNVKFNAEQKESVKFAGKEYQWQAGGRNGVNNLAVEYLRGNLGYPSFAILDKDYNLVKNIRGYKTPEQLLQELKQ
ncbi:MAG TPA: thioredoxin fold domain-containing protein [Saprospiraceae bacterium]|nr:thioredoxin fold domain-containing protein [Saprospiraceae bacterium]MCB9329112.1 thioredoxin fold domain-containing protein [Lewinellaceae bacterium]HPK10067.1 thioredoxin fold domain-containing protein [Saprospiraceae bacterium]HRX29431.1 thioredoxin fold domain-containing protein [Saprospiraceae bacterium]